MSLRKILHLDLDAFFCAVEEQRDPSLRGKPFAVGGRPEARGVVASCSYAARQFGVRSALPMGQALKLCPQLLIVPSHFMDYRVVSRQVMRRLHMLTPLVEQISIDEAFLDVSELDGSAVTLAQDLQATIRTDLGLPCSLGVATNKLVAKIANNVGKAAVKGAGPPNAIQVVPPGQEAAFLAPLPAGELWGVGPKTAQRLAEWGMTTIGDIAAWDADDLARRLGKHGADLARRARGVDDRPVVTEHEAKSISQERTFTRDVADGVELRAMVRTLAEGVSRHLRREGLAGSTVKLKLRWSDFTTPTRQLTLSRPTDDPALITQAALGLFDKVWETGRPVRLLGVGVSALTDEVKQFTLWDLESPEFVQAEEAAHKQARLEETMRKLSRKYGDGTLRRGPGQNAQEE